MDKAHPIPHDGQRAPPYGDEVAESRPAKFRYRHLSLQRPHIHEAAGNRRRDGNGRCAMSARQGKAEVICSL
jgi:hypothetical protein